MNNQTVADDGRPARLHNLDAIRGIAAFVVMVHHCLLVQPAFSDYFFTGWRSSADGPLQAVLFYTPLRLVWAGIEAVILFYILSGFVIALPWIANDPPRYPEFAIKRIFRIYLPYLIVVLLAAVPNAFLQPVFHVPGGSDWINTEAWSAPVTASNLIQHALMFGQTQFRINGAVHSLVWEMWVSLVFPVLILPVMRWRLRGALGLLMLLLGLTGLMQLFFASIGRDYAAAPVLDSIVWHLQRVCYYSLFFVLGASLALYRGVIVSALEAGARYHLGLILLAAGLMLIQARLIEGHGIHNLYVAVGAALVIAASFAPGAIRGVLSHASLQFLGKVSFGLYLTHVPVILVYALATHAVLPLWANLLVLPPICTLIGWAYQGLVIDRCVAWGKTLAGLTGRRTGMAQSIAVVGGAPRPPSATRPLPAPLPVPLPATVDVSSRATPSRSDR